MEVMKVCKFYDEWCKGERDCKGCKHYNDAIEFVNEGKEEKKDE